MGVSGKELWKGSDEISGAKDSEGLLNLTSIYIYIYIIGML